MRRSSERGIAMVATMLVMLLVSALMVGFTAVVMSDQRFRGLDRDRTAAFYAAHAGLEKLTTDLGNLFFVTVSPTAAQLTALQAPVNQPSLQNVTFVQPDGSSGYRLLKQPSSFTTIASGPYQGLIALVEPYRVDVTARTSGGGEVHLARELHAVAIPVFQFGYFSTPDLSFFAGPVFNFGGRVHTNANLFLSGGSPLTMSDKVTAVGEIIRQNLANGVSIDTPPAHNSTVSIPTGGGGARNLLRTEGSETGALGSAWNEPTWTNVSVGAYNHYIRNGRTGARPLNLALITIGGTNTDLVRRPATPNENVVNPTLFGERYFSKVSLRILLSDTAAQLTGLPTITAPPPVPLDGDWVTAAPPGYAIGPQRPPIALSVGGATTNTTANTNAGDTTISVNSTVGFSKYGGTILVSNTAVNCTGITPPGGGAPGTFTGCTGLFASNNGAQVSTYYTTPPTTSPIGGFLKIEKQDAGGNWTDVTMELLTYGIASASLNGGCPAGADPNPNAIVRLQRISNSPAHNGACGVTGGATQTPTDYWPQALYDTREGLVRDQAPGGNVLLLGGVMHYITLDVRNLSLWFQGLGPYAAGTGTAAWNNGGYSVYFSDRRGNQNAGGNETGEYGWEDFVNPAAPAGTPNGTLDPGEDVNGDGVLQTYGAVAHPPAGSIAPLDAAASQTTVVSVLQAHANRAVLFRRALKLVNGSLGNIVAPGLTVVAENPVYVQGDWNANAASGFGDPHVATSVIADAVTLLTNNWNDNVSFTQPYVPNNRPGGDTWFRLAIIAGKGLSFPWPNWGAPTDFGTDGGAHNFLRMLEGGNRTVNYRGSLATFYFNRQAVGTFKCCATVYTPPTRNFNFDTDFLDPAKLPPLTPMFRDVNTVTFSQEIRPGR